jgi:hypothetical protein
MESEIALGLHLSGRSPARRVRPSLFSESVGPWREACADMRGVLFLRPGSLFAENDPKNAFVLMHKSRTKDMISGGINGGT